MKTFAEDIVVSRFRNRLVYAMPALAFASFIVPSISIIPGIYNQHYGVQLALLGTLVFFVRCINAVLDPFLGYFIDNIDLGGNGRKKWTILGASGLLISSYFLFFPPEPVSPMYFLIWFSCFMTSHAVAETAHTTWGASLTDDLEQRARLFSLRSVFVHIGFILLLGMPLLPIFPSTEYTPEIFQSMWLFLACYLVVALSLALRLLPENAAIQPQARKEKFLGNAKQVLESRKFRIYTGTTMIWGFALSIGGSLQFLVITSYFGIGEHYPLINVLVLTLGMLLLSTIQKLIVHFKLLSIFRSIVCICAFYPLAYLLVSPGKDAFWPILAILSVHAITYSCLSVVMPLIITGIADENRALTGQDRTASFIAYGAFFSKVAFALGGLVGFSMAGLLGFDPSKDTDIDDRATLAIQVVLSWMPCLIQVLALLLSFRIPHIERHESNKQLKVKTCAAVTND